MSIIARYAHHETLSIGIGLHVDAQHPVSRVVGGTTSAAHTSPRPGVPTPPTGIVWLHNPPLPVFHRRRGPSRNGAVFHAGGSPAVVILPTPTLAWGQL